MRKIPEITTKVANDSLRPYFEQIFLELVSLYGSQRNIKIRQYTVHIEAEAQKASSISARMQLRINLHSLLEKLGVYDTPIEVNVNPRHKSVQYPRFSDEAYTELFN